MEQKDKLLKDLKEVRLQISANQIDIDNLKKQENQIISDLQALESPMMSATNLWCRITNALIAKYKIMAEENPQKAVIDLERLQGSLLADGFLTEEELDKAL